MHPKGWKKLKLREVGVCIIGLTYSPDQVVDDGGILVLRSSNIKNGKLVYTDNVYVDVRVEDRLILEVGDLLICVRNGSRDLIGKSALVDKNAAGNTFGAFMSVFRSPYSAYLYQLFHSDEYKRQVRANLGATINQITSAALNDFEFSFPPDSELKAIVQILEAWDKGIASSERLLASSQRLFDSLLQQLLLKPAARGDWDMRTIADISERIQRRANEDEELPVLMISSGSGFVRQDEKYSRFMAGKSVENYIALDRGEFAYNKGNSKSYEFGCVFSLNTYERGLVPNVYVCFKLSLNLNAVFYEHLFRADFLHDQLGALVNTGVRNNGLLNIKPVDFLACKVPVPPLDVQNRVAEVLSTAAKWVALQERDLELLKQEKAALMSQLLTGKRRVKLPEAEAEVQV